MASSIYLMSKVIRVIEDYLYVAYFKVKWKEITNLLKSLGYDYSHIKLTRNIDRKEGEKDE